MKAKYLTLDERVKQLYYARIGYPLFTIEAVTLQSKITNISKTLDSFQIYARNESHAESLKNRVIYRFGDELNADLNQKSLGLLTDKSTGFGLVQLFTFQIWKDPSFKRHFKTNKPGTIPVSYIKKIIYACKPARKDVDITSLSQHDLKKLKKNAQLSFYSFILVTLMLMASLFSQLLTLTTLHIYNVIFIVGKIFLIAMFFYACMIVRLDIKNIKESLK